MTEDQRPAYLTPDEVADLLRLERDRVLALLREGKAPGAFRVDGPRSPWRIPSRALEDYVMAQQALTGTPQMTLPPGVVSEERGVVTLANGRVTRRHFLRSRGDT